MTGHIRVTVRFFPVTFVHRNHDAKGINELCIIHYGVFLRNVIRMKFELSSIINNSWSLVLGVLLHAMTLFRLRYPLIHRTCT